MRHLARAAAVAGVLVLSACSTTVGTGPKVSYSDYHNHKQVEIAPHGAACTGWDMQCSMLGAQWSEEKPDQVFFIIGTANEVTSIRGATIFVGDDEFKLSRPANNTQIDRLGTYVDSARGFSGDLSLVKAIVESPRSAIRVETPAGYMEDVIKDGEKDSKAYHALVRFLEAVEG
ncbi:hypothetical protein ACR0ST_04240 [Aliidiomarina sp. Khilg15.8]